MIVQLHLPCFTEANSVCLSMYGKFFICFSQSVHLILRTKVVSKICEAVSMLLFVILGTVFGTLTVMHFKKKKETNKQTRHRNDGSPFV